MTIRSLSFGKGDTSFRFYSLNIAQKKERRVILIVWNVEICKTQDEQMSNGLSN